jgi:hypothetical protein
VNGLNASYCDEGAFILNTTTLQAMLRETATYLAAVTEAFAEAEYDPVVDCTNDLFHRHTAELDPIFRPGARDVLSALVDHPDCEPVILTNSLGGKVHQQLATLGLDGDIAVLGDTRQYDMRADWPQRFPHPDLGMIQVWPVDKLHRVDLRRPAYYGAMTQALESDPDIVVVADTFSLPGALPLNMGIRFLLLRTPYTPDWCAKAVKSHPLGRVLGDIRDLPTALPVVAG